MLFYANMQGTLSSAGVTVTSKLEVVGSTKLAQLTTSSDATCELDLSVHALLLPLLLLPPLLPLLLLPQPKMPVGLLMFITSGESPAQPLWQLLG